MRRTPAVMAIRPIGTFSATRRERAEHFCRIDSVSYNWTGDVGKEEFDSFAGDSDEGIEREHEGSGFLYRSHRSCLPGTHT